MKIRFVYSALPILSILLTLPLSGCLKPDLLPIFATASRYQGIIVPEVSDEMPDLQQKWITDPPIVIETIQSDTLDLTLEQAIAFAMGNNRDLKVQQVNPELAATLEAIERGVYDPELFAELEFLKEKSSEAETNGTWTTVNDNDRKTLIGVRQKLPSGTTLEASMGQDRSDTSNKPQEHSSRVGLSITQSLLRGLGPTVNLVSLRQAQLNTEVSTCELRGITESLLAATETSYWDYVLAGQKIDIFERSLAVALQQLDEIEQRIEVGTMPRIESAAANAEVARRQQALIDMHSTLEERRLWLLRLINPDGKGSFDLQLKAVSTAEINPPPITDLDDRLLLAEKLRPDLNEARLRLKQQRLQTIRTKNGLLPRLDLFINLGKTGYADSFSGSFKDLDDNSHDFSAGIKLSHFLNNRQARGRDLAAHISRSQAAESVENLKQLVVLDVRLAVNEFERNRKQINATRATRLLQDETLNAEKERFDVGDSTALQVAQAQRDLLLSAIDEAEAVINCRKSLVKLYLAEGSLLERRGVRVDDTVN